MRITGMMSWAGLVEAAALVAAAAVCLLNPDASKSNDTASGSGDSATGTIYTQPVIPTMSMGSSATAAAAPAVETAASTLATSVASPTYKATARRILSCHRQIGYGSDGDNPT
jgi:hypothetical protein